MFECDAASGARRDGVDERDAVCLPVRICRLDRLGSDARACLLDCLQAAEIENEKGLWVRRGALC